MNHSSRETEHGSAWRRKMGVLVVLLVVLGVFGYSAWVNLSDEDHQVELTKR